MKEFSFNNFDQKTVRVFVHNAKKEPIENAEIKLNDVTIAKTNSNGKASFEATSCTFLSLTISKAKKYKTFKVDKMTQIPQSFEVELEKAPSDYVEKKSSHGDDDKWKHHITTILPTRTIEECQDACTNSDNCDYYIFNDSGLDINCFFGDFLDTNPMEFSKLLKGIVTIHKKGNEEEED